MTSTSKFSQLFFFFLLKNLPSIFTNFGAQKVAVEALQWSPLTHQHNKQGSKYSYRASYLLLQLFVLATIISHEFFSTLYHQKNYSKIYREHLSNALQALKHNSDFRFAILAWLIRKQRMKERQRKKIKERERKNSLIEQKLFLKSLIKSCSRHIEVNRMMETMVDCIPSLSWTRVSGTSWSHNWNRDQQHKGRQLRIKCIIAMTGRFAT